MTEERVRRVEFAEAFLKQLLGLQELRVRLEAGDLGRIELPIVALPQLVKPAICQQVTEEFLRLGFRRTTVDLAGFRSGSLNDSLPLVTLGLTAK